MKIYIIMTCAYNINFQGVIFMAKFVRCTRDCDAVITIFLGGGTTIEFDLRISEGWIFYLLSLSGSKYNLCPVKKSTETNVNFDVQDKKLFKQGFWDDITDVNVLRHFRLYGFDDLSKLHIKLQAPKSCFEEIK